MNLAKDRPERVGSPRYAHALALAPAMIAVSFLALSLGPSVSGAARDGARGVTWRTDLGAAQAEARERDLPLWIQFSGPWCPNCRRMDRGAFVSPAVVTASRDRFIPVKLRSDEHEQLALSLGLRSLPSTVIAGPGGEVIDRWEGFADPDEFLAFLGETLVVADRARIKEPIALASYCPVSLIDGQRLVPGRVDLVVRHAGRAYLPADEAARRAFLANPSRFAPANGGDSPVGQVELGVFRPGDPRFGVVYRGHLYLCAAAEERALFLKNPERYAHLDPTTRAACPHCRGLGDGPILARRTSGRPAPSIAVRGPASPAPVLMEAALVPVNSVLR